MQKKPRSVKPTLGRCLLKKPSYIDFDIKTFIDVKKWKSVFKTKWTKPAVRGSQVHRAIENEACVYVVFTQNVVEPLVGSLEVLLEGFLKQLNHACQMILDDARTDILITIEYSNGRQLNENLFWAKGPKFLSGVKSGLDNYGITMKKTKKKYAQERLEGDSMDTDDQNDIDKREKKKRTSNDLGLASRRRSPHFRRQGKHLSFHYYSTFCTLALPLRAPVETWDYLSGCFRRKL
ncbi:hypothetical protein DL96DRAFT_1567951 [Flagelloscypha sp. PMI_526]|nr:hypothetical protein DL96DRAFT_1567951 [Flagelloscypha sp. PMI_526]